MAGHGRAWQGMAGKSGLYGMGLCVVRLALNSLGKVPLEGNITFGLNIFFFSCHSIRLLARTLLKNGPRYVTEKFYPDKSRNGWLQLGIFNFKLDSFSTLNVNPSNVLFDDILLCRAHTFHFV